MPTWIFVSLWVFWIAWLVDTLDTLYTVNIHMKVPGWRLSSRHRRLFWGFWFVTVFWLSYNIFG